MGSQPLTQAEQDELPKSNGAKYPKGAFLVCRCGGAHGPVAAVSAHRSRRAAIKGEKTICGEEPFVFMSDEDAIVYAVDVQQDPEIQARLEIERAAREAGIHPAKETSVPAATARPRGRPPKAPTERSQAPRALEMDPLSDAERAAGVKQRVKIYGTVSHEVFDAYGVVCENAEFGFKGTILDYLEQCHDELWEVHRQVANGELVYRQPLGVVA